jgi:hypothetical protein
MTRIFLDTEFTELTQDAQLISLGLACENGDWFYAELDDYEPEAASDWVQANVIPLLSGEKLGRAGYVHARPQTTCYGDTVSVYRSLLNWLRRYNQGQASIQFWADVYAWDWLLFTELFTGALMLPPQIHYMPGDLSTLLWAKGYDPDITRESLGTVTLQHPKLNLQKHQALYDALLELEVFKKVMGEGVQIQ